MKTSRIRSTTARLRAAACCAGIALVAAACSSGDAPPTDEDERALAEEAGLDVGQTQEELRLLRLCGGPRERECPPDRYCRALRPNRCPDDGAFGVCAPRPDACTLEFDPVCGCDGRTYPNACAAAAAGVAVESRGPCEADPPEFCGGIAGVPCPEGDVCIDDPSDDCDPEAGGADCGGICVPDLPNPCAAVLCPENTQCVVVRGQGVCKPTGPACGDGFCAAGQVCCNPSCGICTPPGGVCIQIACE